MPIISCDEASDTRVLAARLAAQPKRLAKALERLDLMENTQGELRRVDEAERRVTEILWETGQELLTGWAGQVADAVTAEARAAVPVVGHVKKVYWTRCATFAPIRLAPKAGLATHSLGMAHGHGESVHEMPWRLGRPQHAGPVPMQKGFDVTEVGQWSGENRTIAQMGKPCGPMPAEVLPDGFVAAVTEGRADERHRQRFRIRPFGRKTSMPRVPSRNDRLQGFANMAINDDQKGCDGHGRLQLLKTGRSVHPH